MKINLAFLFLFPCFLLSAQISEDGLLAYYPFNGNVQDEGASQYHGENYGASFGLDDNGNENSSLTLNGKDNFVDLSVFAVKLRDNFGLMSIYFKVKFEEVGNDQTILSLGTQGENLQSNVFEIEYENDGFQLETEVGNAASNAELNLDQGEEYFDGKWHEVLMLLDGFNLTYYRDGQKIYEGFYQPTESLTTNLFLGCYNGTGGYNCCFFGGQIDELQFYDRLLDINEIVVNTKQPSVSQQIELFPNPTSEKFTIQFEQLIPELSLRILSVDGRLLATQQLENLLKVEVTLPDPAGTYFIELYEKNELITTEKIIKQ